MFGNPTDYTSVLNKLGAASFGVVCVSAFVLLSLHPDIASGPMVKLPFLDVDIPVIWMAGAVVVSILFRVIKLHDRVSDIFKIRESYDVQNIIRPMYRNVSGVDEPSEDVFVQHRRVLMKRIFYSYVPGPPGANQISDHLVLMAWESIWWMWVFTEAAVIALLFVLISIFFNAWLATVIFATALLLLIGVTFIAHRFCKRQTALEVEAILDNEERRVGIRHAFNEILR